MVLVANERQVRLTKLGMRPRLATRTESHLKARHGSEGDVFVSCWAALCVQLRLLEEKACSEAQEI